MPAGLTHEDSQGDNLAAAAMCMEKKVVFCNKYGEKLAGVLHTPKAASKAPAAIICHGLGASKENKKFLAIELEKRGIIVLRFDFSGCGESEGDYTRATVRKNLADLDAAVKFVRALKCSSLYLIGYSHGGMVSAIYAAKNGSISGLATISAVFSYKDPELLIKGLRGMPRWIKKGYIHKGSGRMFLNNYADAGQYDMPRVVRHVGCPIIIFHGDADDLVPFSHALAYSKNAKAKRMVVLKGAEHFFPKKYDVRIAKELTEWISATS